jgi:hypothetical protein
VPVCAIAATASGREYDGDHCTEPGKYSFQWRMVQERVRWFGKLSPLVEVEVRSP